MALMISDKQIELKCIYYMVNGVGLLYKQISKIFRSLIFEWKLLKTWRIITWWHSILMHNIPHTENSNLSSFIL